MVSGVDAVPAWFYTLRTRIRAAKKSAFGIKKAPARGAFYAG